MDKAKHLLRLKARDNARTPIQWDSTSNGGFCPAGVKPWMRVNDDYIIVNAALQVSAGRDNDFSMLISPYRFWKRSLELRKQYVDLSIYGTFEILKDTHSNVFAFKRKYILEESITILNFSKERAEFTLPVGYNVKVWIRGSYDASSRKPKVGNISLQPWEGMLGLV